MTTAQTQTMDIPLHLVPTVKQLIENDHPAPVLQLHYAKAPARAWVHWPMLAAMGLIMATLMLGQHWLYTVIRPVFRDFKSELSPAVQWVFATFVFSTSDLGRIILGASLAIPVLMTRVLPTPRQGYTAVDWLSWMLLAVVICAVLVVCLVWIPTGLVIELLRSFSNNGPMP